MLKNRLIPALFLKNGYLVRSENFQIHQSLGNAVHQVERFNAWNVDELIYIDISEGEDHHIGREDMKIKGDTDFLSIIELVARSCFMPLTVGGGIRTIEHIRQRLSRGADKVIVNAQAIREPDFITKSARIFGEQCIVVSIDARRDKSGRLEVVSDHGRQPTGMSPAEWARKVATLGAGEIFLNSVDRDGSGLGYDIELLQSVTNAVSIPVIACGGVGNFKHFAAGILEGKAAAVAAGNIFHFTELSAQKARQELASMNVNLRA